MRFADVKFLDVSTGLWIAVMGVSSSTAFESLVKISLFALFVKAEVTAIEHFLIFCILYRNLPGVFVFADFVRFSDVMVLSCSVLVRSIHFDFVTFCLVLSIVVSIGPSASDSGALMVSLWTSKLSVRAAVPGAFENSVKYTIVPDIFSALTT